MIWSLRSIYHFITYLCTPHPPVSGIPYLQYLGLDRGWEGNSCPNGTSSLTNTPYLPVMYSVWQGDLGICGIHKPRTLDIMKENLSELGQSRLRTNPSGKISMANPPPFSNICPRYARWGIYTVDRHISCIKSGNITIMVLQTNNDNN